MGAVYRATDTKLNRDIALKLLPDAFAGDPDRLARFTREAQILASLNHPNIASIYGVEDRALVLEFVDGQTLSGPLSEEDAIPLFHQLIDALEYAHEKGIVHRDLKPANIKITPETRLKVLDFGVAKAVAAVSFPIERSLAATRTMEVSTIGHIVGTPAYMSPEQARGHSVDRRTDIWAFGVVLYEILTGRALFARETVSDTLAAVLSHEPDFDAVPPRFRRLLRLCIERNLRRRLRDISGARILLEDAAAPVDVVSPFRATHVVAWKVAALAAAALAFAASVVAWRATRPLLRPLTILSVDLGRDAVADQRTVFALSPDGRRIVFTARSPDGLQILATRSLDQSNAIPLNGTDGAADPFFSPDGEWIGFFSDGKLKKVPAQGGAPVVLADGIPDPRGAAWGQNGFIVFAANPSTGLSRIPVSGGALQRITDPATKGQQTHRWPQFLPGARALIFTAFSSSVGSKLAEIDALDLETGQSKTVQQGGYFGRYLPSGHLVYVHDGTLFAVRFDPSKLRTTGAATPVLRDVAANSVTATGRFDFPAAPLDGGTLVYISGRPESVPARIVWLDPTGKAERVPSGGGIFVSSVSPDGRLFACHVGAIGAMNIQVWDGARDVATSITSGTLNYTDPVWTPDGRHLVFSSSPANGPAALWWARADGSGAPWRLRQDGPRMVASSFSPDGQYLAYTQASNETGEDIWILPLDMADPENPRAEAPISFLRTPAAEFNPMFSPDGRWMAYASQENGPMEIFVRSYSGAGGRWQVSSGGGVFARWSRTHRQLLYATIDGRMMVSDYEIRGSSFVPGKPRVWSDTRIVSNMGRPTFEISPDGRRVLTSINTAEPAAQNTPVHVMFLLNFFDELKRRLP